MPRWLPCKTVVLTGPVLVCCCGAAGPDRPLGRLGPVLQTTVIAALVALVLVGLALMAFAWLMARWVRRFYRASRARRSPGPIGPSDWDPQPWVGPGTTDDRDQDSHA